MNSLVLIFISMMSFFEPTDNKAGDVEIGPQNYCGGYTSEDPCKLK